MPTERARINRLRRKAKRDGQRFHVARRPLNFGPWPDRRYYAVDATNTVTASWRTLEDAEEAFKQD
jgi:hypothetical protein